MAAIPDATLSVTDGALGITEPTSAVSAVIGSCSSGTINTFYTFADTKTLRDTLVSGPAVEAAAHALAIGGGVVYVVRVDNTSTVGVAGAVTHTGTGVSVGTVTGAPYDNYRVIVEFLVGGTNPAANTATFRYSLDGGDNYSAEIALPVDGDYVLVGTGLTLHFTAASLVALDTYSFTNAAPGYNSTELTTAFAALCADPRTWKFVHIVGSASSAANQATLVTAVATLLTSQEAVFRYTYAIMEMPDLGDGTTGDAASIAAFSSVATTRVSVAAGYAEIVSVLTGRVEKRPAAWALAARRHKAPISEDSMRVRSGPLPGVTRLWRDEQIHRGLDAVRFATLRTHIGKQGFWITNGKTMAAAGSDYQHLQHREIMDVTCTIARAEMLDILGESVRVNPLTHPTRPGAILEQEARVFENRIKRKLATTLLDEKHVSDISVQINRTDNIISTQTLRIKVRVLPKAYFRFITADMGFTNPRLELN